MSARSTQILDRRRAAQQRLAAIRRHPVGRHLDIAPHADALAVTVVLVAVAVLVMFGLVMVMSASALHQASRGLSPWRMFQRQAFWAVAGALGMWIATRLPLAVVRRMSWAVFLVAFGLSVLPLIPGVGLEVNGARAWVKLGTFTFQPAEFLKIGVLLAVTDLLTRRSKEMHDVRRTLHPALVIAAIACLLCLIQKDLGTAIIIGSIVFSVAFLAGAPGSALAASGLLATAIGAVFVVTERYRLQRFVAFLDLEGNKAHLAYQTWQAQIALASGGWWGQGVGRGLSKLGGYLPLAYSDFIFAAVAEETGLIGVLVVVGGLFALVAAGVRVALRTSDRFSKLLVGGIVSWLTVQSLINIGGVIGLMPVTGLTLPFISAGGTSLFACMVAAGLMVRVARAQD